MMRNLSGWGVLVAGLILAGCASVKPSSSVQQPMTAKPAAREAVAYNDGAIYHAASSRPLFEDRRARMVGDILTITIIEKTTANEKSSSNTDRSSSISAATPSISEQANPAKLLFKSFTLGAGSTANKLANKSDSSTSNDFTGTITVTVIEVLSNGNLLVSGEKQVVVNQANEFVRFSGVVNPNTITGANTVQSTQVADARLEYKGSNYNLDASSALSTLGRFFLSVLPF
jgi:flagellar L-ring protein precursor FlgH